MKKITYMEGDYVPNIRIAFDPSGSEITEAWFYSDFQSIPAGLVSSSVSDLDVLYFYVIENWGGEFVEGWSQPVPSEILSKLMIIEKIYSKEASYYLYLSDNIYN